MLEIRRVSKTFDSVKAVSDVTLHVPAGRITAVIGPNGAGKSTLLHMACGLLEPDSGHVLLDGRPIATYRSALYRRVSAVLEDSSLAYMSLKGWDNLYYQGALYGFTRRQTRQRCAGMLDLLDLGRHMSKHVGDWSRGTQQKLALVTSLLPEPEVLVLDEATLGLDVVSKRDFLRVVRSLADHGTAVVIASHQSEAIEHTADDMLLIEHGRALWSGPFDEFIREHADGINNDLEHILLSLFDEHRDMPSASSAGSPSPARAAISDASTTGEERTQP